MAQRQRIGENSLDGLFQAASENDGTSVAVLEEEQQAPKISPKSSKKQRIIVQISEDVIERIKNAVYWTPGLTLALAALAEEEPFLKW